MEGEEIHRREVTCISDQIASHREVKLEPKFVTNKIIAVSTVKPVKESFQSQVEIIENVESEKLSLNNKDCFVKHTPRKGEKENAPYNGANGRPEGSLERIFVEKRRPYTLITANEENRAAQKIQRMYQYWTAPRMRALRYDPISRPTQKTSRTAPGAVRLPGYELSSREAVVLLYLVERGRLSDLTRSIDQLRERGADLTEMSILPLISMARRLGESAIAAALLDLAEKRSLLMSPRAYSEVVIAYTEDDNLEYAEATVNKALKKSFLPNLTALIALQNIGSYPPTQWRARWRLSAHTHTEKGALPYVEETAAFVFTRGTPPNREVYCAPHALIGLLLTPEGQDREDSTSPPTSPNNKHITECVDQLYSRLERRTKIGPNVKQRLSEIIESHPEGHADTQLLVPRDTTSNDTKWQDAEWALTPQCVWAEPPTPSDRARTLVHLRVWHLGLPDGSALDNHEPGKGGKWKSIDDAVWLLSRRDALGQLSDLVLEAIKVGRLPTVLSQPETSRGEPLTHRNAHVLVACEESMVISSRLSAVKNVDVLTVDLAPPEMLGPGLRHMIRDAATVIDMGSFHGLIGHPPCPYLALSAVQYNQRPGRRGRMKRAAEFFRELYDADIPLIAIENPKHHTEARQLVNLQPTQTIQPFQHGIGWTKATQLFLKGLPLLTPTNVVPGRMSLVASLPESPLRSMIHSRTFDGIAQAMVEQWSASFKEAAGISSHRDHADTPHAKGYSKQRKVDATAIVASAWLRDATLKVGTGQGLKQATRTTAKVCEILTAERNPSPTHVVFHAWKRAAELNRGSLFGKTYSSTAPESWTGDNYPLWMVAQQLLREHRTWEVSPEGEIAPVPTTPLLPVVKRVVRRNNKWWAWIPYPGPDGRLERHVWRRMPETHQTLLEQATNEMRPSIAAACWQPVRHSLETDEGHLLRQLWLKIGGMLGAKEKKRRSNEALRGSQRSGSLVASLMEGVSTSLQPCPNCGMPRAGPGSCPRGLGALSCKTEARPNHRMISFVPETKAPERIPTHQPPRRVAAAVNKLPIQNRKPSQWRRLTIDETEQPRDVSTIPTAEAFGESDVSDTRRLSAGIAHCAWLKDVHICVRNPNRDEPDIPYLIGEARAWAPAAMSDSGAAISLIGTELLKSLPPDALVHYEPLPEHAVQNVCGANGEPLYILGEVTILLSISRILFRHTFQIVDGGEDNSLLLFGCDFLGARDGDVCVRTDKGRGNAGYCVLSHPKYGRLRFPLTVDPDTQPPPSRSAATVVAAATTLSATPLNDTPPTTNNEGVTSEHDLPTDKEPPVNEPPTPKVREYLLYNAKPFRVKFRSEREMLMRLPNALQSDSTGTLLVKPLESAHHIDLGVKVGWSVATARKGEGLNAEWHVPVRVINLSYKDVTVPGLMPLAELETEIQALSAEDSQADQAIIDKVLREVTIDPNNVLTEHEIAQVQEVITKRYRAFARDSSAPGVTHAYKIHLPLKEGAIPFRHAPPRLGPEARAFVESETAKLERAGIIYRTNESPYSSRVVIVRKKDGTMRLCQDFRSANRLLKPHDSPLPRMDQAIQQCSEAMFGEAEPMEVSKEEREIRAKGGHGPAFYCVTDLQAGFNNIPIHEDSQHITAFSTEHHKFCYRRLPFGLQAGPSHCQSLMNEVMAGLQQISVTYMDDTCCFARSFEQMLERMDVVLERYERAGLTLKASKCIFMATKIEFLGHILSRYGVEPSPSKVSAIEGIPPESINTITKIRSFLGATSFYRKHIKGYADIARPLIDLTKKDADVGVQSQKEPAQNAIIELKKALCSAPVLAMPQWNKQWIVRTDASITGIGAVLAQEDDNGAEHPVCYFSRTLTPAETRYHVSELEMLAVINAVKQWRHYLWTNQGRKFLLWVDHGALLWLHTAKDTEGGGPASRLQRWYLKLQEYHFEVRHRPGKINFDADFLSRMAGNPEYEKLKTTPVHAEWAKVSIDPASTTKVPKVSIDPIPTTEVQTATGDAANWQGGESTRKLEENAKTKSKSTIENPDQNSATELADPPLIKPPNLEFVPTGLLDTTTSVLGHQCNCVANRSWGITKKIFEIYPEADVYKEREKTGPSPLGSYHMTQINSDRTLVNLFAQTHPGPAKSAEEQTLRVAHLREALRKLLTEHPQITAIALPAAIGAGPSTASLRESTTSLFQFAVESPSIRFLLHHRAQDRVGWLPPHKGPVVAAVTTTPHTPIETPILNQPDNPVGVRGDLTLPETVQLITGLSASTNLGVEPAVASWLKQQLRDGRPIKPQTIEASIAQLADLGLARRAAELLEIAVHAELATKRGHYLTLVATSKAGMHLQSAPILRRLNVDYMVRATNTRKALEETRAEFEGKNPLQIDNGPYDRHVDVAKVAFISRNNTHIWCHSRDPTITGGSLDLPGGKREPVDKDVRFTLRREIHEEIGLLPPTIQAELEEEMRNYPLGHARAKAHQGTWHKMHVINLWAVAMPEKQSYSFANLEPEKHFHNAWVPIDKVLSNFRMDPRKVPYADALEKAVRRRKAPRLPMVVDFMPWQPEKRRMETDQEPLEQTQEVQHLRHQLCHRVATCRSYLHWPTLGQERRKLAAVCINGPRRMRIAAVTTQPPTPTPLILTASSVFDVWKKYSSEPLPHKAELQMEQSRDLWCREIMDHLLTEYIPPALGGAAVSRFCVLAVNYTIREGLLFRYHSDPRMRRSVFQLAIPSSLRESWLEAFHDRLGHAGIERTYQALRLRAYWPGMREAVQEHIAACHECALAKKDTTSSGTTILPITPSRPFDVIQADVLTLPVSNPIGPYHQTYSKLLIFCDSLTRWVEAVPLPSEPNAEEVVDAFVQNVVCRHGVPKALVCDRGSNLIADLCQSVYTLLGMDLRPSTAYHHQTAGMVERFNRSLNGLLRATGQGGKDWPLHVPWLCFYYRTTPHAVTKESPAFLNLGRDLRYPQDQIIHKLENGDETTLTSDGLTHSATQLQKRLRLAWEYAGRSSLIAQQDHKERRDLSRREPLYEKNQWVLLKRPVSDQTGVPKGGKLAPLYEGPYRIEEILDRGNVKLRDLPRKIHNEFHVTRLRPYVPHDEVPVAEDEFKVKAILARRGSAAQRQYLVWWVGWPKSTATWEPQANLMTRCFEMVAEFDSLREGLIQEVAKKTAPTPTPEQEPTPNEEAETASSEIDHSKDKDAPWKKGDRALVPAEIWPDEPCHEFDGQGWLVRIIKTGHRQNNPAVEVEFVDAKDIKGRRFKNEWLTTAVLEPATKDQGGAEDPDRVVTDLLHQATQQAPATAAKCVKGVWHYQRAENTPNQHRARRWIDERYFSPQELISLRYLRERHLEEREEPANALVPKVTTGTISNTARTDEPSTTPHRPEKAAPPRTRLSHKSFAATQTPHTLRKPDRPPGSTVVALAVKPLWSPLTWDHLPDSQLLGRSKAEMSLGIQTTKALAETLCRSESGLLQRLEQRKDKLYQPTSTEKDVRRWREALTWPTEMAGSSIPSRNTAHTSTPKAHHNIPLLITEESPHATPPEYAEAMREIALRSIRLNRKETQKGAKKKPPGY